MKKQSLILFLLLFSTVLSHAQQVKQAQPDSIIKIIPLEGRHNGYLYTIGGRLYTRQEVVARLLSYTPSAAEYHMAKSDLTWGYVSFGAFGLAMSGAVISFAHDSKLNGAYSYTIGSGFNETIGTYYPHHNKTGAYVLTGASVALLTTAIIEAVNGSKHVSKALYLYNFRFE